MHDRSRATKTPSICDVAIARRIPGFYVVDAEMTVLAAVPPDDGDADAVVDSATGRLAPAFFAAVRGTTRGWGDLHVVRDAVTRVADRYVVHLRTTRFARQPSIAVIVAPAGGRRSLERAVATYGFTSRETDVLGLLLAGAGTAAIAQTLAIARPTVLQHVANLLLKTGAHRRSDLIALVLSA